ARLRELMAANAGALRALPVLMEHKFRLETAETVAAFDSELACLWWPDGRVRYRWHDNPLHHRVRAAGRRPGGPQLPRPMMVARVDAPTEPQARALVETSIRVEREGLRGVVALDARGKPPTEPYGVFDETIRDAANLIGHAGLAVKLDDAEPVFKPGSVDGAALYCGWYSLRNYVPGVRFVPGAVAYHVASLELISLHAEKERGWCRGLMADGAVATLGAVAEPYLQSFPQPNEFYPLLLTGKLTLAEAYWATTPMVSWMNALVGDPLYRPFAANPGMKVVELPERLRGVAVGE
ncbi:MAG TPA: TIGR03790 family protein, partial [Humisphaera sp.]